MSNSGKIRWITYTGVGIALVVVVQYLGNMIPNIAVIFGPFSVKQLIIGTLVNCVLLVFTAKAGLASGAVIGVLSSVMAALIGISQMIVMPFVAIGNALLCVVYSLLGKKLKLHHLIAMCVGAVLKCAFLWITVPMVLGASELPEKQIKMMSVMFSWPQGITAVCGGILSWPILLRLKKSGTEGDGK